jgi:hypothetical protein
MILTNSVLNVVPLHYMQAFILPKWVIKQITKTTRRFLWREQRNILGWPLSSCLAEDHSKVQGGLGIIDL